MRQMRKAAAGLRLAPWVVAGTLLLGAAAVPAIAQEATPAAIEAGAETTETPVELPAATTDAVGGAAPSAVPSTGVGPGLAAGGMGALSLGALVGAGVATVFALRERLRNR